MATLVHKKSLQEFLKVGAALQNLMNLPNIDQKTVYWLDRNIKNYRKVYDRWCSIVDLTRKKYMEDIPGYAFVPPKFYKQFKEEITKALDSAKEVGYNDKVFQAIFSQFEIKTDHPSVKGIPIEQEMEYRAEIQRRADEFDTSWEYYPIAKPPGLDSIVLQRLNANDQISLNFLFDHSTHIHLV